MWSAAAPLPLALGAISAAGAGRRRDLVGVGRRETDMVEGGDAEAEASSSSSKKQLAKQQRQLSGSDVLMALQRAAEKKNKKKLYKEKASRNNITIKNDASSSSSSAVIVNVKPLYINPQWAHQLHQLETRLEQLPHA